MDLVDTKQLSHHSPAAQPAERAAWPEQGRLGLGKMFSLGATAAGH